MRHEGRARLRPCAHGAPRMTPRVSVVIPLYNKAATVERALRSIADQTFRDFDVVIVDDGSTDDGARLAEQFPDERVRVIRQENRGPGAARNRGVTESAAELVAFLDADDEWLPEFLERSVALIDVTEPRVAAVVFGFLEGSDRRPTESFWRRNGLQPGPLRLVPSTPAPLVVTLLQYMNPWAMLVRRDALSRYGGFYEAGCRYAEDNYLWLKLILNDAVCIALEPLVWWHSEASGLSRNLDGARPIEPFFTDPAGLYAACPPAMLPLLRAVLAIRAGKTAAVLSFWGRWREGRSLLREFSQTSDVRYSWVKIGRLTATPLGAAAGLTIRKALALKRRTFA
jgi:GT2 family glycosyltransferase